MGCVFVLSNMVVPPAGTIPLHEWFDFRPIPEIVGDNTTDPELLGIPEHIPPSSAAAEQAATEDKEEDGTPPVEPAEPDTSEHELQ